MMELRDMLELILVFIGLGIAVVGIYLGLVVLFGQPDTPPTKVEQRMTRDDELWSAYYRLSLELGREPTTLEIWEATPYKGGVARDQEM